MRTEPLARTASSAWELRRGCHRRALGELETVLREDALQMVKLYGEEVDADRRLGCRHYFSRWIVEERRQPALVELFDQHGYGWVRKWPLEETRSPALSRLRLQRARNDGQDAHA